MIRTILALERPDPGLERVAKANGFCKVVYTLKTPYRDGTTQVAQRSLLNASALARALAVDGKTIAAYLDLLVDLLLVRRFAPWHGNVKKAFGEVAQNLRAQQRAGAHRS